MYTHLYFGLTPQPLDPSGRPNRSTEGALAHCHLLQALVGRRVLITPTASAGRAREHLLQARTTLSDELLAEDAFGR